MVEDILGRMVLTSMAVCPFFSRRSTPRSLGLTLSIILPFSIPWSNTTHLPRSPQIDSLVYVTPPSLLLCLFRAGTQ